MKVSLNEIKKYVPIPKDITTDDLVKLIGSRLVEVEEAIDLAPKYKGILIAKVMDCEPIPDTHLHLCQIDAGDKDNLIQVVCGAPNVRKNLLVVYLPPGAIVPQTFGEENFKLTVRKLRGYESHGMLAGLDELDLGDDHSGIAELDPAMPHPTANRPIQPGDAFAEAFDLNDIILDIENKSLTHRPDTFGLIGFAREVAGILNQPFTEPEPFTEIARPIEGTKVSRTANVPSPSEGRGEQSSASRVHVPDGQLAGREGAPRKDGRATGHPESGDSGASARSETVTIDITDKTLCPRYTCAIVELKNPTAKDKYLTPQAIFLYKSGMRPINKIVDVTNIVMLQTGQPLHAFDYNKFLAIGKTKSPQVQIRLAKNNEPLQLLDGKTIKCTPNDIIIASNNIPVALAGAMGGAATEIDASTTKIFLESATFSLYHLRKTQMHHGIFSEAITRFTKGQPPAQTAPVLNQAIKMLAGTPLSEADAYPGKETQPTIEVTPKQINALLGTSYGIKEIEETLTNVGFNISEGGSEQSSASRVHVPDGQLAGREGAPRKDGRATGHPESGDSGAPNRSETAHPQSDTSTARSETILLITPPSWRTDIHIKEDVIEEIGRLKGFDNIPKSLPTRPFQVSAPNPLLDLKKKIRATLSDNLAANELLTYTFVNKNLQQTVGEDPKNSYELVNSLSPDLQVLRQSLTPSLLEKVHLNLKAGHKSFTLYEMNQITAKSLGHTPDKVPVVRHHLALVTLGDYYQAKAYLAALLESLNLPLALSSQKSAPLPPYFEPSRAALANDFIALGEIRPSVLRQLKIPHPVAAFELDLEKLLAALPAAAAKSFTLSKYPSVDRDLTLKLPADTPYQDVYAALTTALAAEPNLTFVCAPVSLYQKSPASINLSFHLAFASTKKTLESSEISAIMERVVASVDQYHATVV